MAGQLDAAAWLLFSPGALFQQGFRMGQGRFCVCKATSHPVLPPGQNPQESPEAVGQDRAQPCFGRSSTETRKNLLPVLPELRRGRQGPGGRIR